MDFEADWAMFCSPNTVWVNKLKLFGHLISLRLHVANGFIFWLSEELVTEGLWNSVLELSDTATRNKSKLVNGSEQNFYRMLQFFTSFNTLMGVAYGELSYRLPTEYEVESSPLPQKEWYQLNGVQECPIGGPHGFRIAISD